MRILILSIIAMTFSLSGCSSQKKLVNKFPLELGEATCQSWVGGRPEAGSGLKLEIPVLSDKTDDIQLQQAYFRGKIADLKLKSKEGKWIATANFRNTNLEKPDIIMDADATKEVGNQPPQFKTEIPFELETNECVISYLKGDTIKYFKIDNVKEQEPLIYK